MFELIEGILKGFGILLRLFVEGGLLDLSLSGTGRCVRKLSYPPYWFKPVPAHRRCDRLLGGIVWGLLAYAAYWVTNAF